MTVKGSFATGSADPFSDLDLAFVARDSSFEQALARRDHLVNAPGEPVASFTGDHVGVPGLLIVLYDDLIHVDFSYVRLSEFPNRPEDLPCRVIWEREKELTNRLAQAPHPSGGVDLDWIEARMWTWVWYTHTKILRGEVYEALDTLQFMRSRVLFPLLSVTRRERPNASRRTEQQVGDLKDDFAATVPGLSRESTMRALQATVELYVRLADPLLAETGRQRAKRARHAVMNALAQGLGFEP